MGKLDGKIAIVTGAASGIGRRCAERFAEEGAQVVIGDIDIEGANSTADQIVRNGGKAFALPLDLADEDSVRGFYEQVLEHCGRVDIRSEERRVGKEGVSKCRSLWWRYK